MHKSHQPARKQQGLNLDDILHEASQPKTPSIAEQPLLDPPGATSVEPQVQATPDAASPTLSPATSLKTTSNSSEDQQAELAALCRVLLRSGHIYSSGTCYGSDRTMVAQAASLDVNAITSSSPYFQYPLQSFPFTPAELLLILRLFHHGYLSLTALLDFINDTKVCALFIAISIPNVIRYVPSVFLQY